jgi:aryl-alcohol dehydrogenase-like predicted oxidoreductase
MRYRLLGNSGLRVSEAALGAMTFGEDWGWGTAKDEARKVYDAFREAGRNFIDTANLYTNGTSESFLGEFMQGHRQSVVLATKYTNAVPGTDPNAAGNQRKNMVQAVEASLKRLRTDYIDLYWVHIWDQLTPVEEVMRGLDDLVRAGKVLYVGISDAPAWWIAQANTLAHLRGWSPFVGLQIEYSLIERTVERELIPMAKALNVGVTAWSPLAGGVLTGKYHGHGASDQEGEPGRMSGEMMKDFLPEQQRTNRVVAAVKTVADEVGHSLAQVALASTWASDLRPRSHRYTLPAARSTISKSGRGRSSKVPTEPSAHESELIMTVRCRFQPSPARSVLAAAAVPSRSFPRGTSVA